MSNKLLENSSIFFNEKSNFFQSDIKLYYSIYRRQFRVFSSILLDKVKRKREIRSIKARFYYCSWNQLSSYFALQPKNSWVNKEFFIPPYCFLISEYHCICRVLKFLRQLRKFLRQLFFKLIIYNIIEYMIKYHIHFCRLSS